MPTSSFYTTVTIKGPKQIKRFIAAMEEAKRLSHEHKKKKFQMSRSVVSVSNEELEKMIPMIKIK